MRVRGAVHHIDVTVKSPEDSRGFYQAVLGFMGYVFVDDHERGFDMDLRDADGFVTSFGVMRAKPESAEHVHDRYAPGLHHIAWNAASREDVDALYALLQEMRATILDPPLDYPRYGDGYYAVFFADPDGLKLEYVFKP